ncbi:hypothetical protein CFC21_077528 [Triticum aestivum]|uniref:Uncharacterized protein n=2 Tax=Triticum aestivum TaxID=4565 RepID=A0A3B6MQ34_WHEAT|nr:hypothetical protein CFC21_077528 [Triticum aestivum]
MYNDQGGAGAHVADYCQDRLHAVLAQEVCAAEDRVGAFDDLSKKQWGNTFIGCFYRVEVTVVRCSVAVFDVLAIAVGTRVGNLDLELGLPANDSSSRLPRSTAPRCSCHVATGSASPSPRLSSPCRPWPSETFTLRPASSSRRGAASARLESRANARRRL